MFESKQSRRRFIKNSTVAATGVTLGLHALGAPAVHTVTAANDKIRVGFIGVGNRGSQLLRGFMAQEDVQVAALCDVYEPYIQRDRSKVHQEFLNTLGVISAEY